MKSKLDFSSLESLFVSTENYTEKILYRGLLWRPVAVDHRGIKFKCYNHNKNSVIFLFTKQWLRHLNLIIPRWSVATEHHNNPRYKIFSVQRDFVYFCGTLTPNGTSGKDGDFFINQRGNSEEGVPRNYCTVSLRPHGRDAGFKARGAKGPFTDTSPSACLCTRCPCTTQVRRKCLFLTWTCSRRNLRGTPPPTHFVSVPCCTYVCTCRRGMFLFFFPYHVFALHLTPSYFAQSRLVVAAADNAIARMAELMCNPVMLAIFEIFIPRGGIDCDEPADTGGSLAAKTGFTIYAVATIKAYSCDITFLIVFPI